MIPSFEPINGDTEILNNFLSSNTEDVTNSSLHLHNQQHQQQQQQQHMEDSIYKHMTTSPTFSTMGNSSKEPSQFYSHLPLNHNKDIYSIFHQQHPSLQSTPSFQRLSQPSLQSAPSFQRLSQLSSMPHILHPEFSFYNTCFEGEGKIPLAYARVWLEHQSLWRTFSVSGNEMIITKMGRRMFPVLSFGVTNLNYNDFYSMEVQVIVSDNNRYKYVSDTGWRINGVGSQQEGNKIMTHPDAIQTGDYWQRNGIAFKRIKLTNKKTAKEGSNNIVLNSMHKYHIQLVIKQIGPDDHVIETRKFEFQETEFIAVTAYQNDEVTQLKIQNNPFAKAFRGIDNNVDNCDCPFDLFGGPSKRRKFLTDYDTSLLAPPLSNIFTNPYTNNVPLKPPITASTSSATSSQYNIPITLPITLPINSFTEHSNEHIPRHFNNNILPLSSRYSYNFPSLLAGYGYNTASTTNTSHAFNSTWFQDTKAVNEDEKTALTNLDMNNNTNKLDNDDDVSSTGESDSVRSGNHFCSKQLNSPKEHSTNIKQEV